jgi:hypothetical protein
MDTHSRSYHDTLLHRKRGDYGPLALFELDVETWAIVWQQCLADENACRLIISEDPNWFNHEWGLDGRRPNPTYKTQREAMGEVIRALQMMKAGLDQDDVKQSYYSAYISLAEYDLHRPLTDQPTNVQYLRELPALAAGKSMQQPLAGVSAVQVPQGIDALAEVEQTPPAAAAQAKCANPRPKPWDNPTERPKGLNFVPDQALHAKMEWVSSNVPGGMSRLRMLREGVELLCNQLIAEHYDN